MTYLWPDDMPLLSLNGAGDRLDLLHLFNTTHITGDMGSGKSSGSAAHLHMALLRAQCGGLVVCPKPTDYADYMKQIRRAEREKDVILMRPTANWGDTPINCLNVLDVELNRFGRGKVNVANVTALLMKVIDMIDRQTGPGATNEAFFRNYAEKIITAGHVAQSIVSTKIDLKLLVKFVNELPNTLAEIEEDKLYSVALMKEARAVFGENAPFDFMLHHDFVFKEWPITPANSRGSGALTVQVMLTTLLSHPLRPLLFEGTSFDIDQILSRQGILLLDMPVENYAQGAIAGMILIDVVQRACQTRPELGQLEPQFIQPVYELVDEYPHFAVESHERHALMARSSRSIPIYISQSLPSVLGRFQDKDRAKSMLEVTGCRWAHQTGSYETAEWFQKCIGQVLVKRKGEQDGFNWNFGPQDTYGHNRGTNVTTQLDWECPARIFTRLLRGGKANNLKTEAVFWRSGEKFKFNRRRYLPVCFPQDFRPGRHEARVIARQNKGGETNHGGSIAQEYLHRAAEAGRERLRSIFQ